MEALNCRLDALVSWDLADLVAILWRGLIFPVSLPPLYLLLTSVECLVWRETLFPVLGHIFDLLSAFCYFPLFSSYSRSLTMPLSSSSCSLQFSSSTFIPHRMKYVPPKRIRKSHEWDHLFCCVCPALAFPKKPINSKNSKYGHNWKYIKECMTLSVKMS